MLIAGQGAAAYAAALYAARYRVNTVVAGERFGGETAIGGAIENYPGHPEIDGFDLMLQFQEQVTRYDIPIRNADVTALATDGDHFRATLSDGAEVESSAVHPRDRPRAADARPPERGGVDRPRRPRTARRAMRRSTATRSPRWWAAATPPSRARC